MIEVPGIGRPAAARDVAPDACRGDREPRAEELFSLVQQVLRESGHEELLSSGIVLTGGSSMMQGMVELGEEIFHMPVRIGMPRYSGGLAEVVRGPRYAIRHGSAARRRFATAAGARFQTERIRPGGTGRMRDWFPEEFLTLVQPARRKMFEIVSEQMAGPVIAAVGVCGAGGNADDHMIEQGVERWNSSP